MNRNKIYFTKKAVITEISAYAILFATTLFAVVLMITGGKEIPIRYDLQGNVEAYGSSVVLIIMPISMLLVNLLMSFSNHVSEMKLSGFPFMIKPGREFAVCSSLVQMVVLLQVILAIYALAFTILYAMSLGSYMLLATGLMAAAVFTVMIVYMVKTARIAKKG